MKQIFILTNFSTYLKSYSPIIVVGEQLKMMTRAGYKPVLITSEGWNPPEDSIFNSVATERIVPAHVYNEPKEFNETDLAEIEQLYESINNILPDDATVITHDLIFLPDYVKHNVACRRIATERPSISWIHWIHSATSPHTLINERSMYGDKYKELLNEKFPNSIVAFPNAYDIPRVAKNFSYEEDEVFEVPHSTDPTEGMAPLVRRLYDQKDLGEKDIIMVYPLRLDRGKNAEINVRVIAQCKAIGLKAHLIFCDFQSTGDDKVVYREDLKRLAEEQGAEDSVTFLSEFDDAAQMEISHDVVLDLFTLSNFFIMPSKSETYSLVAQEAMLRGNFCIMNHDFAPFRQIYGKHAIYRQFSSNIGFDGFDGNLVTDYGDGVEDAPDGGRVINMGSKADEYMRNIALNMSYYLENNKVISGKTFVRRDRNPDAVFRMFLEPLLYRSNNE